MSSTTEKPFVRHYDRKAMTPTYLAAQAYAADGWPVFPMRFVKETSADGREVISKRPRIKRWPTEATVYATRVHEWWTRWPDAGIGIVMGERSGLYAIDVDGPKGRASLAALVEEHGDLPTTLTQASGRDDGGMHYLFQHEGGLRNGKAGDGIDTRGEGGYVIVAPTVNPYTGRQYRWTDPSAEPAPLPTWLAQRLPAVTADAAHTTGAPTLAAADAPAYAASAMEQELDSLRQAQPGARNTSLNDAAFNLGQLVGGELLAEDVVRSKLLTVAEELGLPRGEAEDTVRSGIDAGRRHPRGGPRRSRAKDEPRMFTRVSAADLAAAPPKMTWAAQGLLIDPTYGVIAGEQKTLKTYLAMFIALGIASGEPVLDEFVVPKARPVHLYVGEGGRVPFQRRLQRVAQALDLDLAKLNLSASFETAPILSDEFKATLARDLNDFGSDALFILDPLYAFHGSEVDAGNLYKRGAMLTAFSGPVSEAGASALIVDHFTKTGNGTDLNRIQQAGVQQWADSWLLMRHRRAADVEQGQFFLGLDVGSRQWGGMPWSLDLSVGRLDADSGEHDGAVTWELRKGHEGHDGGTSKAGQASEKALQFLSSRLRDDPWQHTQSELEDLCGGNSKAFRDAFDAMKKEGLVVSCNVRRIRDGGSRRTQRTVWAKAGAPLPEDAEQVDA